MMIKVSRLIVCALVVLFGAQVADMRVVSAAEPQRLLGVRYHEYTIPAGTRICGAPGEHRELGVEPRRRSGERDADVAGRDRRRARAAGRQRPAR